ncbi:hypothetical protein TNCV_3215931 [Trichonephila clavipes]|nr:hypothetical protein TNCV_3215931 [Trichonephila clavipes]
MGERRMWEEPIFANSLVVMNTRSHALRLLEDRLCVALVSHFFLAQRCSVDVMLQRHVLQVDMLEQLFSFYQRKTSNCPVALQPHL